MMPEGYKVFAGFRQVFIAVYPLFTDLGAASNACRIISENGLTIMILWLLSG